MRLVNFLCMWLYFISHFYILFSFFLISVLLPQAHLRESAEVYLRPRSPGPPQPQSPVSNLLLSASLSSLPFTPHPRWDVPLQSFFLFFWEGGGGVLLPWIKHTGHASLTAVKVYGGDLPFLQLLHSPNKPCFKHTHTHTDPHTHKYTPSQV